MSARSFTINPLKPNKTRFGNVTLGYTEKSIAVWLHDTIIVYLYLETGTIKLNSGGWRTVTTKAAINHALDQLMPFGRAGVFQKRGRWFIQFNNGDVQDFYDGITIGRDGYACGPLTSEAI